MSITVEQVMNNISVSSPEAAANIANGLKNSIRDVANVLDYGADPTGGSLDNDAFTRASNAARIVYIPAVNPKTGNFCQFRLADWAPTRAGTCITSGLIGFSFHGPYYGPMIKKHTSATNCIIDLSNTTTAISSSVSGIVIDGVDRSVHAIKQGADNLTFANMVAAVCADGYGGGWGQTSFFQNTHAYQCKTGYKNQVDCKFYGARATACQNYGIRWESGASFNSFHGRVEWCGFTGSDPNRGNISMIEARDNVIDATIDAGYHYGIRSVRGLNNTVRGQLRRNGRADDASDKSKACQIYLTGNQGFDFTGCWSNWVDDDGNPPTTPKYGCVIDGGSSSANSDISLKGILRSGTVRSIEKTGLSSTRLYIKGTTDGLDEG